MVMCGKQAILLVVAFHGVTDAFVQSSSRQRIVGQIKPLFSMEIISTPEEADTDDDEEGLTTVENPTPGFDTDTALFCAGLAFDAYVEPPADSSRWERGSKGMNVAFSSSAFTKNLYQGMVEVTPVKCSGLPDEDDNVEAALSGRGVDAKIMVAAVEGKWKEDVELLKKEYHEGISDLTGAAHIGQSSTAWSNVNERKSNNAKKESGKALPYHIPKSWGKDAQAVWPDPEPFYVYVQDPANCLLLFTLFDDDVIGEGSALGSTYIALKEVLPQVKMTKEEVVNKLKTSVLKRIQSGEISADQIDEEISRAVNRDIEPWQGELKLTSKPRIKNKNGQITMGAAAGGMVAGPVGAAVGAALGSLYEGQVKGRIEAKLRYLPIPQGSMARNTYEVLGGMPGINWGELYEKHLARRIGEDKAQNALHAGKDLELCFFINHDETGGCCSVYRSLEKNLIVVSFRGTCEIVDLITDTSIAQNPWVQGEDPEDETTSKVHVGFRKSMNSISRRLKELVLATVPRGENMADYDMLVTGHSLGGALATLFTADIGEFGIDAGRALPQTEASDDWWKAITSRFGDKGEEIVAPPKSPPRPKSLRCYTFGSPRVGNRAFTKRFDEIMKQGNIDEAYRIVNNKDIVARVPRSMVTLNVDYDHCGKTVLVEQPTEENELSRTLWVEGETDDTLCEVRDSENRMSNPTSEGGLIYDLMSLTKGDEDSSVEAEQSLNKIGSLAAKLQERLSKVTVSDVASVIGIDKNFSEREVKIVQSLVEGDGLANHMEDSYYAAMGRAVGFRASVDEEIVETEKLA
ncbi:unnamed protein product [Cylindrotheca closterium]|uniref:Fungal lipase-type domain-containing protein n=1 Tax=Cylindrotheca closterium TaxID=2856 RepID=A0AAD2JKP4_9STRA|nr:unnamed protein product [Cylindrotheca closterium]